MATLCNVLLTFYKYKARTTHIRYGYTNVCKAIIVIHRRDIKVINVMKHVIKKLLDT